jgi:hypothetical protein
MDVAALGVPPAARPLATQGPGKDRANGAERDEINSYDAELRRVEMGATC